MSPYVVWFSLAVVLVALELMTGTFYLLMIALGLAAGGVVAWLGGGFTVQLLICAVVAVLGVLLLRRSPFGRSRKTDAAHDPNVNLDIGQTVHVQQWDAEGRSRVAYRGSQWDVEWIDAKTLASGNNPEPPPAGVYQILAVRGNRLIVSQ